MDYGRLGEESPQAKAALEVIRTEFNPRQRDLQNQQAALKTKQDKLQKDGATMTQDQRAAPRKTCATAPASWPANRARCRTISMPAATRRCPGCNAR